MKTAVILQLQLNRCTVAPLYLVLQMQELPAPVLSLAAPDGSSI